jgi:hypothetical protein
MASRELIYKDEAYRAVLHNATDAAWRINHIKPVMVIDDTTMQRPKVEADEYWVARIKYEPLAEETLTIVKIHRVWEQGGIQFTPFGGGEPKWITDCMLFELIERIEMERFI